MRELIRRFLKIDRMERMRVDMRNEMRARLRVLEIGSGRLAGWQEKLADCGRCGAIVDKRRMVPMRLTDEGVGRLYCVWCAPVMRQRGWRRDGEAAAS